MKINLTRVNDAYHMQAKGRNDVVVNIDGSPAIGGEEKGPSPMELVLMGAAGCSSIDVISILKKGRATINDFDVEADAVREKVEEANIFTEIDLHFIIDTDAKVERVIRAIELSLEKYCSVSKMLEKTAEIKYRLTYNGERVK